MSRCPLAGRARTWSRPPQLGHVAAARVPPSSGRCVTPLRLRTAVSSRSCRSASVARLAAGIAATSAGATSSAHTRRRSSWLCERKLYATERTRLAYARGPATDDSAAASAAASRAMCARGYSARSGLFSSSARSRSSSAVRRAAAVAGGGGGGGAAEVDAEARARRRIICARLSSAASRCSAASSASSISSADQPSLMTRVSRARRPRTLKGGTVPQAGTFTRVRSPSSTMAAGKLATSGPKSINSIGSRLSGTC